MVFVFLNFNFLNSISLLIENIYKVEKSNFYFINSGMKKLMEIKIEKWKIYINLYSTLLYDNGTSAC